MSTTKFSKLKRKFITGGLQNGIQALLETVNNVDFSTKLSWNTTLSRIVINESFKKATFLKLF